MLEMFCIGAVFAVLIVLLNTFKKLFNSINSILGSSLGILALSSGMRTKWRKWS